MELKPCSCFEIAGEDPRCILHGTGTRWAKENPDLCELSELLSDYREALEAVAACGDLAAVKIANAALTNKDEAGR